MKPPIQQNNNIYNDIYHIVKQIPYGKVATYGQIAEMLTKCTARMVGYALAVTPDDQNIPWHRVINSRGKISLRSNGNRDALQKVLLKSESIIFNKNEQIDLNTYRWQIRS